MNAELIQIGRDKLRVGAWYSVQYGWDRRSFCVIHMSPGTLTLECPNWLLSAAQTMPIDTFFSDQFNPLWLGYGKRRWFWGWIRRRTDCIGTLFTKPF